MCDVHLIEQGREEVRLSLANFKVCSHCDHPVVGRAVRLWGVLDDKSPGTYEFFYHPDCVVDMEFDRDEIAKNDGCFSYGTPARKV